MFKLSLHLLVHKNQEDEEEGRIHLSWRIREDFIVEMSLELSVKSGVEVGKRKEQKLSTSPLECLLTQSSCPRNLHSHASRSAINK